MTFVSDWIWTLDELIANAKGFDKAPTPTLLVEGPDDVEFFQRVLKNHPSFTDNFWIMAKLGGKKTYWARKSELNFHYCAALDRDHDPCNSDPLVVYTDYYCMESYLILEPVVTGLVDRLAAIREKSSFSYSTMFKRLVTIVLPLATISWIKSEIGGKWLELPSEDISIWKVVDWGALQTDDSRLRSMLQGSLGKIGLTLDDPEFQYLWAQAVASLLTCGAEDILRLVSGKHLLEAMYRYFNETYPSCTAGKKDRGFFLDLCSFAPEANHCKNYIDEIARVTFAA